MTVENSKEQEEFLIIAEIVNNKANIDGLLILLNEKGIINPKEFYDAKSKALEEMRKEFPNLFENERKDGK